MITLVVLTFAAFGLSYVVGHSVISRPLREWAWGPDEQVARNVVAGFAVSLLECPACCGFWIGFIGGAAIFGYDTPAPLVFGFYIAGTNFFIGRVTGLVTLTRD